MICSAIFALFHVKISSNKHYHVVLKLAPLCLLSTQGHMYVFVYTVYIGNKCSMAAGSNIEFHFILYPGLALYHFDNMVESNFNQCSTVDRWAIWLATLHKLCNMKNQCIWCICNSFINLMI